MQGKTTTSEVLSRTVPYVTTVVLAAAVQLAGELIWDSSRTLFFQSLNDALITIGFNSIIAGVAARWTGFLLPFLVYLLSGLVIGAIMRSRWRRHALIFSITFVVASFALHFEDWQASVRAYGWKAIIFPPLFIFSLVCPPTLLGAWLGWGRRERHRKRRRASGLCESCGYNLISIASGKCPECGTSIGFAQLAG